MPGGPGPGRAGSGGRVPGGLRRLLRRAALPHRPQRRRRQHRPGQLPWRRLRRPRGVLRRGPPRRGAGLRGDHRPRQQRSHHAGRGVARYPRAGGAGPRPGRGVRGPARCRAGPRAARRGDARSQERPVLRGHGGPRGADPAGVRSPGQARRLRRAVGGGPRPRRDVRAAAARAPPPGRRAAPGDELDLPRSCPGPCGGGLLGSGQLPGRARQRSLRPHLVGGGRGRHRARGAHRLRPRPRVRGRDGLPRHAAGPDLPRGAAAWPAVLGEPHRRRPPAGGALRPDGHPRRPGRAAHVRHQRAQGAGAPVPARLPGHGARGGRRRGGASSGPLRRAARLVPGELRPLRAGRGDLRSSRRDHRGP